MKPTLFIFLICAGLYPPNLYSSEFKSFSQSKRFLAKIYSKTSLSPNTFYCSCEFIGKKVDLKSCGVTVRKHKKRASRLEWEHIVPASNFIKGIPECRKNGKPIGRKKCAKISSKFREMEANPHNLVPSSGALNAYRSNFNMSEIPGEKRDFGSCDFEISDNKVEPRNEVKGDVARIYFYMDQKYPGTGMLSGKNRKLFEAWNKLDPVDAKECVRNMLIKKGYGQGNEFVEKECKN